MADSAAWPIGPPNSHSLDHLPWPLKEQRPPSLANMREQGVMHRIALGEGQEPGRTGTTSDDDPLRRGRNR
jgi:hypothetical protein